MPSLYRKDCKYCNHRKARSQSVKDSQSYQSSLVKLLTLENEKITAVSQDWQHKKEKLSYQSFSLMVRYQKM